MTVTFAFLAASLFPTSMCHFSTAYIASVFAIELCSNFFHGRDGNSFTCDQFCCGNYSFRYCCNDCEHSYYDNLVWCNYRNVFVM
ncbi:hypothetical protein Ciccas_013800 [Cichlidogyrus casuarinus]|uniref:Shisa N-terminal domain-containing protein n=1 Tax=Cichlidogyrus casuarinus TaxID=1844966 RepID=A0ABD2PJM8_9PLAT